MCRACQDLSLSTRNASPHPDMAYQCFKSPVKKERGVEREEHFACRVCRTRWIREVDRWGTDLGFKLGI